MAWDFLTALDKNLKMGIWAREMGGDCFFFFFLKNLAVLFYFYIIYLWLHWVFVAGHRFSLVLMHGLLTAEASLVSEHQLQGAFGLRYLQLSGSRAQTQ